MKFALKVKKKWLKTSKTEKIWKKISEKCKKSIKKHEKMLKNSKNLSKLLKKNFDKNGSAKNLSKITKIVEKRVKINIEHKKNVKKSFFYLFFTILGLFW